MSDPDFKARYGLRDVINAAGTFTPVGVSRSAPHVADIASAALRDHFIIEELQQAAGRALAAWSGAEAGAVTHCTAASITLAVAAAMCGDNGHAVAQLPDTAGLADKVVLPAGHAVNYGQPITQAIRLSGAQVVLAGNEAECPISALAEALARPGASCLLLVSSRLTRGAPVDLKAAITAAHEAGVPAIIDAAAQDMRIAELTALGADLILISAQKYLAAPTAGVVVGCRAHIDALRRQEKGIGRGMKASKEAICGVMAAIETRQSLEPAAWRRQQAEKLDWLQPRLDGLPGVSAQIAEDPAGMPLSRLRLAIDPAEAGMDAAELSARLKAGSPSIWVIETYVAEGVLLLELVPLEHEELELIAEIFGALLG